MQTSAAAEMAERFAQGKAETLHLHSDAAACVDDVSVEDQQGKKLQTTHKLVNPGELEVDISLKDAKAGPLTMRVKQFGLATGDEVALHSYSEAGRLDSFSIDAGDHQGVLIGTRLDEVASLEISGIHFAPAPDARRKPGRAGDVGPGFGGCERTARRAETNYTGHVERRA